MKPLILMTCANCGRAYSASEWSMISRGQVRRDVICSCGATGEYRLAAVELPEGRPIEWHDRDIIRPPVNGSHFLVCDRPASRGPRTFDEAPPVVVHYFDGDFWLSQGIVTGSYNDQPVPFTHWAVLGPPPVPR